MAMAAIWNILKHAVIGYLAHEALSRGGRHRLLRGDLARARPSDRGGDCQRCIRCGRRARQPRQGAERSLRAAGRRVDPDHAGAVERQISRAVVSILGALMVIVTASGVFSEMQTSLNRAWDVKPSDQPWLSLIRTH
jgi:membrane protein